MPTAQAQQATRQDARWRTVTPQDFAASFGTTVDDLPPACLDLIAEADFRYRTVEGEERDQVLLSILKRIEADTQRIGAPQRQDAWEHGWSENLKEFCESGHDLNRLVPKFIRPNQVMRLQGRYVMPANPNFELDYFSVFRLWLFQKYLKDVDAIYEFGCGTGFNLAALARLYPTKRLFGFDFVPSSRDLVKKLAEVYGWDLQGGLFDMTKPDERVEFLPNSAVITLGSVEQLAGRFEAFVQFLLRRKPALCISVEPTVELYDEDSLVDYLAITFHRKRGYTQGYLPYLEELGRQGRLELLKIKRLYFGSLLMEGFSLIVWRPL